MRRQKQLSIICFALAIIFASCDSKKSNEFGREDYDPNKPVVITGFEPDSGGMATKVFITGSNFGSDVSKIKVYFNDRGSRDWIRWEARYDYPKQPGRKTPFRWWCMATPRLSRRSSTCTAPCT